MEAAATALEELITAWILSLNIPKTKLLVAGTPHSEDLQPLQLAGGSVECVTDFQYLGSVVEAKGGVGKDVCERIAKASRAFGMLKEPVFRDRNLSITTKRLVYNSVVLGVLLYGSETCIHNHLKSLPGLLGYALPCLVQIGWELKEEFLHNETRSFSYLLDTAATVKDARTRTERL